MLELQEVEKFWDYWVGSRHIQKGTLKLNVNFLGAIKQHKNSFLEACQELIDNDHYCHAMNGGKKGRVGLQRAIQNKTIKTKENKVTDIAVESVPEGAFVESLKRSNKSIKAARAEAIGEEAYMVSKRQVEDISIVIKQIKRDLENMLDMSPENAMSLIPGKDFDSKAFFAERLSLTRKLRKANDDFRDMKSDHKLLFGEEL